MKSKEIITCLCLAIGSPYLIGAYVLNNFNPMLWSWEHRMNQIMATFAFILLTLILSYHIEKDREESNKKPNNNKTK